MKCVCGYEGEDFVILSSMLVHKKFMNNLHEGVEPFEDVCQTDDWERVYACA
jgi:hypothetical protein